MSKLSKAIGLIAGVLIIFFMAKCIYMVVCISCTTLPIKIYEYAGTMDQFESNFQDFVSAHQDISSKLSRRGSGEHDARDLIVEIKTNNHHLRYVMGIRDFNGTTEITLDQIFDENKKTGGNNTDDPEVERLFEDFKRNFLPRMERDQHIILKPVFFNF